ncbi:MAG: CsgG/HfaB family protein [Syntrophobacterales bacterium]|jgi:curli biogenesis system outer membrane secretion channel CsgG
MLKTRNGFLLVGLLAAFLFAFGCAGSGGETKQDEESTPRTLPAYNYSGKKIPIVVMDFETRVPGHGYRVGQGASDMLITALVKTKKYRVYERNKLKSIMKEQNLQMSGAVDASTAVQIGKLVGAKYIVTGAVTEFGIKKSGAHGGGYFSVGKKAYRATVDVRAVSVQTGEITFADTGSGILKSKSVSVLGFGGGEDYDEKKASESMRMAIDDVMSRIYIELN